MISFVAARIRWTKATRNIAVQKTGRWQAISLVLITLGFAVSAYLLYRTFALVQDEALGGIDVCSAVFGTGCDETLLTASSWQLGIPLAGWGVVYFGTLACLVVMGWLLGPAFQREASIAALLLGLAGFSISVVLTFAIVSGRVPLCGLCLLVHAFNLLLLPVLKFLTGCSLREIGAALAAAGKYVFGGQTDPAGVAHWKVVGLVTVALLATVLYQWVLVEAERRVASSYAAIDEMVLATFERSPQQEVPVAPRDARLGPDAATAQLVVFSSFQCSGCRAFVSELYRLHQQFPDDVAIVFKHYPLGTACNPKLTSDQQPQSCAAAWAAVADKT